jgi:Patatin-like phospholipase
VTTIKRLPPDAHPHGDATASSLAPAAPRGWWACVLNFALVLWILRVPVATTAFGWLLLGATPQAQDLFTEFLDLSLWTWFRMLLFVLVLTVVWALPTHYAARMLVDTDPRTRASNGAPCLKQSAISVPRLLGLLTFLAVEFALWRSYANMPTLDESDVKQGVEHALVVMGVLVAAGGVAYSVWVLKRPRNFRPRGRLGRLNASLGAFWQLVSPGRVHGSADEESRDLGRCILAGVFVIFLGIFLFGADHVASLFPRGMAVPFILGGWLPFLSYVSGVGRQIRAPLIMGLILLVVLFAVVLGDNHSVRRVASGNLAPMPIKDAVALWMEENGCNPKPRNGTMATPCPRPIIVAAAGGASRAAFMMASIIGYFLDTKEAALYGVTGLTVNDARNRIFAISSVSGGSMGAVMVAAALNAAPPGSDNPPCVNRHVEQWWGKAVNNWRDCFEALTSGDYLTADFFGLAFNDLLPFAWRDRAAVLEDSWRNRFREVVPAANKGADAASCQGLDCPFLSLRPRPGHWIPILVLNGTSEATGGRILTTPLAMTYTPQAKCPTAVASTCPLFVGADSFHQLLTTKVTAEYWKDRLGFVERFLLRGTEGDDVRLSTAALNSARFPFISPPGSIRNQKDMLVDRIVDGGYFENYGALAAKELALAVHAVAPQLRPLVIVISNDPSDLLDPADDATHDQKGPLRPHATAGEVLSEATAPITTFANARTAHGVLAVDQLWTTLHEAIQDCGKLVIQVRIWPDRDKQLSMSWWESSLVQRQIHRQTEQRQDSNSESGADKNQNRPHLDAIWREMQASSCGNPKENPG